jgi:hypothetical protein
MILSRDTSGITDLFSANAVQIGRSKKANLDKTASVYTHCETAPWSGIPANGTQGNPDSDHQMNYSLQHVNCKSLTLMLTRRTFQRLAISRELWREMSFPGDRLALLLPTRFTCTNITNTMRVSHVDLCGLRWFRA